MEDKIEPYNKIKHEGVYLYGGYNQEGVVGGLYILKTDQKPMSMIKPDTRGVPPEPRYSTSLSYCSKYEILFIYGGRNDGIEGGYLSDIHAFHLENLNW